MRCGDFKESYIKDEEIFQSLFVKFWLALLLIFLIILPFLADAYVLYVANLIGFAIIGAVGLNILTGFTGQISLGHAAFVGVGGYTAAVLMTQLDFSFWLALPCAGFAAAVAGLIIGIPSLRVKGLYFHSLGIRDPWYSRYQCSCAELRRFDTRYRKTLLLPDIDCGSAGSGLCA